MMMILSLFLFFLAALQLPNSIDGLAVGSKRRSKPSSSSGSGGGGGGFGAVSKASNTHTIDTSASTQRLVEFLKTQKSKGLDDINIGYDATTGVRGLFAAKNFKANKILCKIPSDFALALSDPAKKGEDAPTLCHGAANFLDMYWNNEQARKLWSFYLDTLPQQGSEQFDPTPDFFDDEALELLEFPRIIRMAKERKLLIETVAKERGVDVESLKFATWLAASRVFSISIASPDDDETMLDEKGQVISKASKNEIRVMVPFIDMANHSSDQPNAKMTLIDPEKDDAWFALESTRPISAGKEIVIAYGSGVDSSVELLMNYGFVPHSNKVDEYMLKKGGDECITSLDGWTTTLEEDETMLAMAEDDEVLKKILNFRIKLKKSYTS